MRRQNRPLFPTVSTLALLSVLAVSADAQSTQRVSVSSLGEQGNGLSFIGFSPFLSGDGMRVVFSSYASNFAPGADPSVPNIYMRDRTQGLTVLVSATPAGVPADGYCDRATISTDGRFVAFSSYATNLVANDTNSRSDIFVRDLRAHSTSMASIAPGGALPNGYSYDPAVSATGRFVAYSSDSTNLVAGDTNGQYDVFLRDDRTGVTERVSVTGSGSQGNALSGGASLSADGRFVAFHSKASNFTPGDVTGTTDVFLRDRWNGSLKCLSLALSGLPGNDDSFDPAISADGQWIVFTSSATDLVPGDTNQEPDVFLFDISTNLTTRISLAWNGGQAAGPSSLSTITPDGRYVGFASSAADIVPGDLNGASDVFVLDRLLGTTQLASVSSAGTQGNYTTAWPSLSSDGRTIATESGATNLVRHDTNLAADIFVHVLP